MCCCIHNGRRCFVFLCLFMVIHKDMVGFFEHLRLLSVCAISMWAFVIEACCVQPLDGFNFHTTARAVIRCQTFTEMFVVFFLRWHHGSHCGFPLCCSNSAAFHDCCCFTVKNRCSFQAYIPQRDPACAYTAHKPKPDCCRNFN